MATKKFKIEFCVEIEEKALKGLSDADAAQKVISEAEETWDLGHQAADESEKGSPITDSYGFEAELVD